jgi:hypothetical protein
MDKIKNKDTKLKVLGYYQLIGGIAGLVTTFYLIAQTATITGLILILYLIALGLYSFSIYCGIQILKNRKHSLDVSLINQYLQLISFAILGYGFKYVSGLLLSVGVDLTNSFDMKFNVGIMSTWEMNWNTDADKIEFNLNLVALFFIIFIDKLKNSKSSDKVELVNVNNIEIIPFTQ